MEDQARDHITRYRRVYTIISLYAMDCGDLCADFSAWTAKLDASRADRVRAIGNTPFGRQCLAAGLLLNAVLGNCESIVTDAFGKPRLPGGPAFNLSHAGDYAVLVTGADRVGVDIERIRPLDCMRVAARFFHPDEYAYLTARPDPHTAFFTVWTLKESYVKALGRGFAVAPTTYCILPDGADGAHLAGDTSLRFRRYDDALPGYRLAVCAAEPDFPDGIRMLSPDPL